MRADVTFAVSGANRQEIFDRALERYREYLADPEAVLPFSTQIDVILESEIVSTYSSKVVAETSRWIGTVTIVDRPQGDDT